MYKYKSLIFSFLVFIVVISLGFCCIKHFISGHSKQMALTGVAAGQAYTLKDQLSDLSCPLNAPVRFGFTGITALALSILTYFCLVKSGKLKMHAKALTESNQRLGEEIIRRKAAEEKSANTAREWARTFDSIPDLISIHSNDFRIIKTNKALTDFLGMKNEDITGKHCYEVFHGTECPIPNCPNVKALEMNTPVMKEIYDQKTGSYFMITASPIINKQNEVIGTVHIIKNITEMKKLEEQLRHAQKREAVGQLAEGVAHYINNIISAIINYNYIMRDMLPGDPRYFDAIDKIHSLTSRASHIARSLLSYSRNQFFELKPLNLNKILENVDQLLGNFIGETIELVSLLSEQELIIMADEKNIEQCIMNLAENARDAMPDGGSLTIKTEVIEINTDFILSHGFGVCGVFALMSVTDTGAGMEEETIQKIFEPFFTTKEVGKGTGLGLSMVFGIIKQHEGYIDVYSRPGHGTTFKLFFPLIKEKDETKKQEE